MTARLRLDRDQILRFRRHVAGLDDRRPRRAETLRAAAWAGLQDSMPRAAVLSLHARIEGTKPTTWEDRSLVQIWGPRYSAYVVPLKDVAVFSLGRHPDAPSARARADGLAERLRDLLGDEPMDCRVAGRALGEHPNRLRYATTTGTVMILWDGARQPTIRVVPPPDMDVLDARSELVRRYLHVLGPGTSESFRQWAGVPRGVATSTFTDLESELTPVETPIGGAWILAEDEVAFRASHGPEASARLLPSGDAYWLLQGSDRELLVPDERHRPQLWTPRVWPGAVLANGEIVGTWRRSRGAVTIEVWHDLDDATREAIEVEAVSFPLPEGDGDVTVTWG